MEEILWKCFKKTGKINYYLFIKVLGSSKDEENKDRGSSSK